MKLPFVSIVIATYNSERVLEEVLLSIKMQSYLKNKIEILIIDGGSKDSTLEIADKFNCKVFNNPKIDQVYGKFLGYNKAGGDYLLLLDSDEVLKDRDSIKNKVLAMTQNSEVKVAVSTGLAKPQTYPDINYYLNEFGDPFSYFMYRNSKDPHIFIKDLKNKYKIIKEDKDKIIFDFSKINDPPFIELTAMGVMVDLKYIKKTFPEILKKVYLHTHLFYLINEQDKLYAVMKHDPIIHYSVSTLKGYLRKIRSRVTSNIFMTSMGEAGYGGREKYHSGIQKYKKYLFILYAVTILPPIIDSIYLTLTRRKSIYLIHFLLTYYTFVLILFFYSRKVFGLKTKVYNYGGK